ncbi:hypothetical protein ABT093_19760 [Kitasatospora sp. NPDC002551]|uniref:hypothetical protein n=1 Tax=Kitasatospora sp. NPDC002551 TaxID=3154539 RepID=UPI003317551D
MGVLHLADGRIVGYRVNDRDYPITMANAKRALNVAHCARRFGRGSTFTAYELSKFSDETGLPPYAPITWWIARGIDRFVRNDANAAERAVTVTAAEAPVPTVKRPAGRAHAALGEARKGYETCRPVGEAAERAVRSGGLALERAGKVLGGTEAGEPMTALRDHARLAQEAAGSAEALFFAACDAADEARRKGIELDVIREGWAADHCLALVAQVGENAGEAAGHLHRADGIRHELNRQAERWARRAG